MSVLVTQSYDFKFKLPIHTVCCIEVFRVAHSLFHKFFFEPETDSFSVARLYILLDKDCILNKSFIRPINDFTRSSVVENSNAC